MLNTWTCHICGEEKDDSEIDVISGGIKGLPAAIMNIRYCKNNIDCSAMAAHAIIKGEFPKSKKNKRKVVVKEQRFLRGVIFIVSLVVYVNSVHFGWFLPAMVSVFLMGFTYNHK